MAFTASQLEALEEAIAAGVRTVTYADRSVTYASLQEMLTLRSQMKKELAVASNTGQSRWVRAGFSRD